MSDLPAPRGVVGGVSPSHFSATYVVNKSWAELRAQAMAHCLHSGNTGTKAQSITQPTFGGRDNNDQHTESHLYQFTIPDGLQRGDYSLVFSRVKDNSLDVNYFLAISITYYGSPAFECLKYHEPRNAVDCVNPWGGLMGKEIRKSQRRRLIALFAMLGGMFYAGFKFALSYYGV